MKYVCSVCGNEFTPPICKHCETRYFQCCGYLQPEPFTETKYFYDDGKDGFVELRRCPFCKKILERVFWAYAITQEMSIPARIEYFIRIVSE